MAPGPPCNEQLVQYTNEHDWPGGFSLPAMFRLHNRSHMVFAAEDASRAQTVVLQPMPVNPSSPPHKVVHTGAVAPGRRDEHFGGFFDFTSAETGELGFVGVGNKSVPLAQRFFGVYVVADPFRLPHPVVEKVVDTLDNVPGGLPHAKRWHALSAPALYRSPSGPGGGLSLIFSGRDYAAPATRGRDLIMKWRASTRSLQMLMDGSLHQLSGLSPVQLTSYMHGHQSWHWAVFLATDARRGLGLYSLPLSATDGEHADARSEPMRILGLETDLPQTTPLQRFSSFGGPVTSAGGRVAFTAQGSRGAFGIYLAQLSLTGTPPTLQRLVDTSVVPAAGGVFVAFPHSPSFASGRLVFEAIVRPAGTKQEQSGLYELKLGAGLTAALAQAAPRAVVTQRSANLTYLIAGYTGFDGECLAFYGSNDAGDALYVIDPR